MALGVTGYVHKSYIKLMNESGSSVKDRIIILDPGHGGKDPAVVNEYLDYAKSVGYDLGDIIHTKQTEK